MLKKELEILRARDETLTQYNIAVDALYRSGVLNFLRAFGRVTRTGSDTMEKTALDGAYTAGFQDALDMIVNFREEFLTPASSKARVPADYGGLAGALERGDLTPGEVDVIRSTRNTPR
jgi:hypothetical protein